MFYECWERKANLCKILVYLLIYFYVLLISLGWYNCIRLPLVFYSFQLLLDFYQLNILNILHILILVIFMQGAQVFIFSLIIVPFTCNTVLGVQLICVALNSTLFGINVAPSTFFLFQWVLYIFAPSFAFNFYEYF